MATREGGPNYRPGLGPDEVDPLFAEPETVPGSLGGARTMMGRAPVLAGGGDSYHLKSASGLVTGPFDAGQIAADIRAERLSGDESVSRDRKFWIPIMAIPDFGAAFRHAMHSPGFTSLGIRATGSPSANDDDELLASSDFSIVEEMPAGPVDPTGQSYYQGATHFGTPGAAALPRAGQGLLPLSASGLASPAERGGGIASGAWDSIVDSAGRDIGALVEDSLAAIETNADALAQLSGVRRVSESVPAVGNAVNRSGLSVELPLPQGFTNFPLPAEGLRDLPALAGIADLPRRANLGQPCRAARAGGLSGPADLGQPGSATDVGQSG